MKEARSIEKAVLTREAALYGLGRPCPPSSCCSTPPPFFCLAPRRDTHFAAGSSRGSFLLAIAVLLAFLASALTNPAPARAADAVLLEGEITVGYDSDLGDYGYDFGLSYGSGTYGLGTFGYDPVAEFSAILTLDYIVLDPAGNLYISIDISGFPSLAKNSMGDYDDNDLELHVGTKVFEIEDLGKNINSDAKERYTFTNSGLSWMVGDVIPIRLIAPGFAPDAPGPPTVETIKGEFYKLRVSSWSPPAYLGKQGVIHAYRLRYREEGADEWNLSFTFPASQTSYDLSGLEQNTVYEVQVVALWSSNLGLWSSSGRGQVALSCPGPDLTGRKQIWPGKVTVGEIIHPTDGLFGRGFSVGLGDGTLSDTTVDIGTNSYTIDQAYVQVDNMGTPNTTDETLSLRFTDQLLTTDREGLRLHVCDEKFDFADASDTGGITYEWDSTGLDWSSELTRRLYLSVPTDPGSGESPDSRSASRIQPNNPLEIIEQCPCKCLCQDCKVGESTLEVRLKAHVTYRFELHGSTDKTLHLERPDGSDIAIESAMGSAAAIIEYTPNRSGDVVIKTTGGDGLSVVEESRPTNVFSFKRDCRGAGSVSTNCSIEVGEPVTGILSSDSDVDLWSVILKGSEDDNYTYVIDVKGAGDSSGGGDNGGTLPDPYLELHELKYDEGTERLSLASRSVSEDVDAVNNLNSRVTYTSTNNAPYFVEVRTHYTQGGTYTVLVREQNGGGNVGRSTSPPDPPKKEKSLRTPPQGSLTAELRKVPEEHDGTPFTFELHFSEAPKLSYKTVRDHLFDVGGGTVTRSKRITKRSNLGWRVYVSPESDGEVTVSLGPTPLSCDANGAVCTRDGRSLISVITSIVPGP